MRRRTLLTAAVLSALLVGLAPQGLEAKEARLHFVGLLHDTRLVRGEEFAAGSLRDLLIVVEYRHLSGLHIQRIELYSPDGSLYQQRSTEVTLAGDRVAGAGRKPDKGKGRGGEDKAGWGERVEVRLPVGGTWITEHALFGAWRVEVYLDSERLPIASGVFVLTP